MGTKTETKVEGLRMCALVAPFDGHFGALVDFDGPWTPDMFAAHEEEAERAGLQIWIGSVVVTAALDGHDAREDDDVSFAFTGEWCPLTEEQGARLLAGRMPLRDKPMPLCSELLAVEVP